MKRRDFLKTGAIAAPAAALAAPAIAQGVIEWKCPTSFPSKAPGIGTNATTFVERVNAMADGRLKLKLYSGGELVPAFAVEDAVQNGTAEIGHGTPYYNAGKNSANHFFTTIPFGMTATEMSAWLKFGGGQDLYDEIYGQRNLVPFNSGNSTVQAAGWFKKEITSVEDFSGLNMRIAGLGGEAMRKLGVNAVLLPPTEIFPAFQSGAIDAAEWVGPMLDQAFGMNKVADICYAPAFHEPGAGLNVVVNKDAWESLSPDLQAIIRNAAEAAESETIAQFEYFNAQAFKALQDSGVMFKTFPEEVLAALKTAVVEVLDEQAAANPDFARCLESYNAYLSVARPYSAAFSAPSMLQRG
ncbi:TRAP-type mannitol/chloroaromatic compound transport system substrate-binding protein [Aliiruegeria haliotis]|uniref:TRAP-type mannitol/chloroaromatic compound transport system substrate-binding protein n=1 Tax=Aliiruegeria haliotis TaxID=1280846 RepID=A0A2T0RVE7_9RHOB|nr:TRAP transporter substrate-binding protein [Aliiruegeria haliotis]PRY25127.1 TRAP-type mannitol/chloroaromatic compound transport system substrate-binding protein [Aliiruegeria haliotis]